MIKIIDSDFNSFEKLKEFCKSDSFGTRIYSHFLTYGYDKNFVDFWVQIDDEVIASAVVSLEGEAVVKLSENTDFSEVSQFLNFMRFNTITFDFKYSDMLSLEYADYAIGDILEYDKNFDLVPKFDVITPDVKDYHNLLKLCESKDFFVPVYSVFLSDVNRRLNKGLVQMRGIYIDKKLVSCAMTVSQTDFSVILGAVATDSLHRKQGFGGSTVTTLASFFNNLQNIYIYTTIEKNTRFYLKNGFNLVGRWIKFFGGRN